jgi:hypothetical protein
MRKAHLDLSLVGLTNKSVGQCILRFGRAYISTDLCNTYCTAYICGVPLLRVEIYR